MEKILGGYVLVVLFIIGCWIVNLVKLVECDFEAPYKNEAIHAIGLIPVASVVTVWFGVDDNPAATPEAKKAQ